MSIEEPKGVETGTDAETTHGGLSVNSHRVTDLMVGTRNENHNGVKRGAYPDNLDPEEFVGELRRFVSKTVQYIQVVGDLNGHAVYRVLNEENDGHRLHTLPWDRFIDETAHVAPESHTGVTDGPARTVARTDFDKLRRRRETEVETGCSCLPDEPEACESCGGK